MKIGDRVFTVKGAKKCKGPCAWWGAMDGCPSGCGPFSGRVVRFTCGDFVKSTCALVDDGNACLSCAAVISKKDGRKVRVRIANLRPLKTSKDRAAFRKARKEWEG